MIGRRSHGRALPSTPADGNRAARRLIFGAVCLLMLLGAGMVFLGRSRLAAEEQKRLADRERLVAGLADTSSIAENPQLLANEVASVPFTPGDAALNASLLGAFTYSPTFVPNESAALFAPDGTVLATLYPDESLPTVADLGIAWTEALAGRPAVSDLFEAGGRKLIAATAPVGGAKPWAVLVTSTDNSQSQAFASVFTSNGLFKTDRSGVAVTAWNPALVGTQVVEPAELAKVDTGTTRMWTSGSGDGKTIHLADRIPSTGYYIGLTSLESEMYADLWSLSRQRDVTLAAVLTTCVLGLTLFGLYRTRQARRTRARNDALLAKALDLVLVADPDTHRLTFVGAAGRDVLGRSPREDLGRPLTDLVHPDDVERIQRLLDDPGRPPELSLRLLTGPARGDPESPGWMWFDVEASDLTANAGVGGILVTCHEIGTRKALEDRLAEQAQRDTLTGVANRPAAMAVIDAALASAVTTDATVSLLFIDLDGFKTVNDTYGHQLGDDLLRVVANRLVDAVRTGCDRAGRSPRDDVVGRLAGDEFVVLLHDAGQAESIRVASRIVEYLGRPIVIDSHRLHVSASVGVATTRPAADGGGLTAGELVHNADQAMYRAKHDGGNRWTIADGPAPAAGTEPGGGPGTPTSDSNGSGTAASGTAVPGTATADITVSDAAVTDAAVTDAAAASTATARRPGGPAPAASGAVAGRGASARRGIAGFVRRGRPTLRAWGPLALACVLLAVVAAVGLLFERADQRRAMQARLDELSELAYGSARYRAAADSGEGLIANLSSVPWTLTPSATNQAALAHFAALTPDSLLALLDLDGQVIDRHPADGSIPVRASDPAFATALSGRIGNAPVQFVAGAFRNFLLIPVIRDGAPVAVFTVGAAAATSIQQLGYEALGSLGLGPEGGLSSLDINGRARFSWDSDLIGRQLVDPAALGGLTSDAAVRLPNSATAAEDSLSFALRDPSLLDGGYVLLELPTSVAFSGLRPDQRWRNLLLLGAVAFTVFALALATRLLEKADRQENDRLEALLHNVHDIVAVTDRDAKVTFASSATTRLLGYPPELMHRQAWAIPHPDDIDRLLNVLAPPGHHAVAREQPDREQPDREQPDREQPDREQPDRERPDRERPDRGRPPEAPTTIADVRLRGADGVYRWFDIHVSDQSEHPYIRGRLMTIHDVTDRKHIQDQLRRQARFDPLTSLPNRTALLDALRPGVGTTAVVFIDLDHFKQINDTFGHQAGDAVLTAVARRLVRTCRPGDVVYRLGGDEFVVILGDVDEEQAITIADRISAAVVASPVRYDGELVHLSATVGLAVAADPAPDPAVLLRTADDAMYRAKRVRRGTVGVRTVHRPTTEP